MTDLFKNKAVQFLFLLSIAFLFHNCSGTGDMAKSGEWRLDYTKANPTIASYAAMHVYSTKTGEYYQLYANEGEWKRNPNVPTPPISITKGNLRMEYLEPALNVLPGLNVYSADTGEWEQFYFQNNEWIKNPNFPSPKISIGKSDLRMDFSPGTPGSLAGLTVYSTKTKKMEIFYLDQGEWKLNTAFPTGKDF